jgi:hypothetical protein
MKLKKTQKKSLLTYHKELVEYRAKLEEERHKEYLESLNEYCLMRYYPDGDYDNYIPGEDMKYAWIRESDGDYFAIHGPYDKVVNPEWLDRWDDMTKKPVVEPIYITK